jgi:hypothetical protein
MSLCVFASVGVAICLDNTRIICVLSDKASEFAKICHFRVHGLLPACDFGGCASFFVGVGSGTVVGCRRIFRGSGDEGNVEGFDDRLVYM